MACEKTEPKCIAVNALLSKMEVREKLLEAQRTCRNGAANRAPGVLAERGVFRAGGAIAQGPGWADLIAAHDTFVKEACESEELIQVLLEMYRAEWLKRAGEVQLRRMALTGEPVDAELSAEVRAAAGSKASKLVSQVVRKAESNYQQAIDDYMKKAAKPATGVR